MSVRRRKYNVQNRDYSWTFHWIDKGNGKEAKFYLKGSGKSNMGEKKCLDAEPRLPCKIVKFYCSTNIIRHSFVMNHLLASESAQDVFHQIVFNASFDVGRVVSSTTLPLVWYPVFFTEYALSPLIEIKLTKYAKPSV